MQVEAKRVARTYWLSPGTRLQRLRSLRSTVADVLEEIERMIDETKQLGVDEYRADPHRATRDLPYIELWKEMEEVARRMDASEEEKLAWASAIKKQMSSLTAIAYEPTPEAWSLYSAASMPHFREDEQVSWIPAEHPDVGHGPA